MRSTMTDILDPHLQAQILVQALPHMLRYDEATVVVKYGGHAMGNEQVARDFARDMILLEQSGVNPVVVHGGGPQIGAMLTKLGIKSEFSAGLRVTDKATVEVVEMVLAGLINKQIVGFINSEGGRAIGLCGKDGNMVIARKVLRTVIDPDSNIEKAIDLGADTAVAQLTKVADFAAGIDNAYVAGGLQTAARLTMPGAKVALVVSGKMVDGAQALAQAAAGQPVRAPAGLVSRLRSRLQIPEADSSCLRYGLPLVEKAKGTRASPQGAPSARSSASTRMVAA
jgi:hypothetical protein